MEIGESLRKVCTVAPGMHSTEMLNPCHSLASSTSTCILSISLRWLQMLSNSGGNWRKSSGMGWQSTRSSLHGCRLAHRLHRSIGVSNFNLADMRRLIKIATIKPAVNQVGEYMYCPLVLLDVHSQIRFHPYNWADNKDLVDHCAKHGIVIEAYSSLTYDSFLSLTPFRLRTLLGHTGLSLVPPVVR